MLFNQSPVGTDTILIATILLFRSEPPDGFCLGYYTVDDAVMSYAIDNVINFFKFFFFQLSAIK